MNLKEKGNEIRENQTIIRFYNSNLKSENLYNFIKDFPNQENYTAIKENFEKSSHYAIVYKFDEVRIIKFDFNIEHDNQFISIFDSKNIQEIRLFSPNHELYIWRDYPVDSTNSNLDNTPSFSWRFIEDIDDFSKIKNCYEQAKLVKSHLYEEFHLVWGTDVENLENQQFLVERERLMQIPIPFKLKSEELPLTYKVHNYFHYYNNLNEVKNIKKARADVGTGLIIFHDARLVQFYKKDINNYKMRVVVENE